MWVFGAYASELFDGEIFFECLPDSHSLWKKAVGLMEGGSQCCDNASLCLPWGYTLTEFTFSRESEKGIVVVTLHVSPSRPVYRPCRRL